MRIAVLIIGLVLTFGLFIQAFVISGLSNMADDEETGAAGAIGIFMALMWLVSCGLVISVPRVSMVLFAIAGLLGFAASGDYPDLAFWGGVSEVLAVFCYFGYRGKVKDKRKEMERDALMRQVAASRAAPSAAAASVASHPAEQAVVCPRCGTAVPISARFCSICGLQRTESAS